MCGIAALSNSSDEGIVKAMMNRIAHRGPDSEGSQHPGPRHDQRTSRERLNDFNQLENC